MGESIPLTVKRYRLADQVYDILKTRILKGVYSLGETILIDEIARDLNTSKTPTREAISRLKGEGLVEHTGRGRICVANLSPEEIAHICELRAALETLALKWGWENIPKARVKENLKLLKIAEKELRAGDPETFREADAMLHDLIVKSANNRWLLQIISQLRSFIEITKNVYTSENRYRAGLKDHLGIAESLLRGDKASAIRHLNSDIEHVKQYLLASLNQVDIDIDDDIGPSLPTTKVV